MQLRASIHFHKGSEGSRTGTDEKGASKLLYLLIFLDKRDKFQKHCIDPLTKKCTRIKTLNLRKVHKIFD
jgi:hypothetical protein